MLNQIGPGIWTCDGPRIVAAAGFHYPTRMVVIALDEGLFLWSPVALTDAVRAEVTALGDVRFLVAPNHLHHMALPDWAETFPDAEVHGAPGVAAKRPELRLAATLSDAPGPWADRIEQVLLANRISDEVVFFHRASGTVLVCDLIQHLPRGWFSGWRAVVARLDLMAADRPEVPRKFRLALGRGEVVRAAVGRILAWPSDKVVIAHGPVIEHAARDTLKRCFRWIAG